MMDWKQQRPVNIKHLVDARLQAHFALEWVSRFGRFLVPPRGDYGHVASRWDSGLEMLVTYPAAQYDAMVMVGLKLDPLEVALIEGGGTPRKITLEGHTHQEIGEWLTSVVKNSRIKGEKLLGEIPYKLHHERLSKGGTYLYNGYAPYFKILKNWIAEASATLNDIRTMWRHYNPTPTPVHCWPHHFDLATLLELGDERSVGLGFSPGDDTYASPYFYINPWPKPESYDKLPEAPARSHWHTEDFFSLLLPSEQLLDSDDPSTTLDSFLRRGSELAMEVIGFEGS